MSMGEHKGFTGVAQDQLCVPGLHVPKYDYSTDTTLVEQYGDLTTKGCTAGEPCRWMLWSSPADLNYGRAEEGSILTVQCKLGY